MLLRLNKSNSVIHKCGKRNKPRSEPTYAVVWSPRALKRHLWLNIFRYSSHMLTRQLHFVCKWSHVWCWGRVWSKDRSGRLSCGGKRSNENINRRGTKVTSLANNCKALSDQGDVENIWLGPIKFIFPLKGEGRTRLDHPLMNTEERSHHKYHVTRN